MSDERARRLARRAEAERPEQPVSAELARDLDALRGGWEPSPGARARGRRRVGLALAVLAVALGGVLLWLRGPWRAPEVDLVAVSLRDVGLPPVRLTASGYVVPLRQITVSSKAQGKIVEMPVEENDRVRAGDLIARLEDDEQRAALRLAEAEAADAARELERLRQLRERGVAAQADLDRAGTTRDVARARLELARVALQNTLLRAPIDGTVIRKIRDEGEFLTLGVTAEGDPGTAVVTLADLSALEVELEVSETEIGKVRLGGVALATPESLPDRRYLADVVEVAAMADRQKGVVAVKVRIREPDRELLPDMSATVSFLEHAPEGAIEVLPGLPSSAVVSYDGGERVFEVVEGRVRAVAVRTRAAGEGQVALLEGPAEGSIVIEAPPAGLADGQRVRVRTP